MYIYLIVGNIVLVISFTQLGNYGRLGNQMFQYAAVKSISIQSGHEFCLPTHEFAVRNMNLSCGTLTCKLNRKYQERFYHFDENVFSQPDGTDFVGYFQSYKYFESISSIIKNDFTINHAISQKAIRFIKNYFYTNASNIGTVGVHVRRGDYIGLKHFHPFCGAKYYQRAIGEFRDMGNYVFIVCSDDIDWCKQHIVGNNVFYSDSKNPYMDMAIMASCDHNIIANSSFSWWSAWLNNNPNKIVLYPSVWFGPKCPQDWYDLIPLEWKKTEV